MKLNLVSAIAICFLWASCQPTADSFDASGVFEADELIVAAEANGKLLRFAVEEGTVLKKGDIVADIDCEQIKLQKRQVQATLQAVGEKRNDAAPQVAVLREQLTTVERQIDTQNEQMRVLEKERQRMDKLVKADAVPAKQLDDITGQIAVLQKQIAATESQKNVLRQQMRTQQDMVALQNKGIMSEKNPINERLPLYDDQLRHCSTTAPQNGTVLLTYANEGEIATVGKPLFKLANLDTLVLRVYLSGNQLSRVRLNQDVTVLIDQEKDNYKQITGKVIWIADKAEFTPKTIQTKDERANLVYATKIKVPNNEGYLKIGMYAEIKLPD